MRQVVIYPDREDGGWVCEVPSLPGCISQGDTREDALSNAREAIDTWIEAAQSLGRDAAKAFKAAGFVELPRRGKGSHLALAREDPPALLTIPNHRELKRGTLRALIRQAGLTTDEFVALL